MNYSFNEKTMEHNAKVGKDVPVWQTPKYLEAKKKAIEIIESNKYGVTEADFWILMNATKNGKMAYNGLIISHNGCLKINDQLENKFDPESVWHDKEGYGDSLVFHYANKAQGIYEVGEISKRNCQNEYPYAMAFKRLFDRVVLKLSKLAYNGIYSDSESDEFAQQLEAKDETPAEPKPIEDKYKFICEDCGGELKPVKGKDGKLIGVRELSEIGKRDFNRQICTECYKKAVAAKAANV